MAQAGERTLVIDADLRNPTIHSIFQATNGPGLSGILTRGEPIEKAINGTTIEGLELLPCGPIPSNPAEILSSRPFAELLRLLTQRYDRILIDSPPVMPLADARGLAGLCDRTLLVLRAEKSTRRISEDTCAGLAGVGARIMGVVVNDAYSRESRDSYSRYKMQSHGNGNGHGRMQRLEGQQADNAAKPAPLPSPETAGSGWR
jgi:capsular exopolysaccharide synthesis family protein